MSLTFDEFKAVSRRSQNEKLEGDSVTAEQGEGDESPEDNLEKKPRTGRSSSAIPKDGGEFTLGDFLEMYEIQGLTLFFLLLDTFAAYGELSALNHAAENPDKQAYTLGANILHSISSFLVFFFAIEIFSLFLAFRVHIFSHLGYLVDIVVVGSQVWAISAGILSVESHMLNFFRMWRLVRLFRSMVAVEIEEYNETKAELKITTAKNKQLQEDKEKYALDVKREQEARSSVEAMLQEYKDEIDTLNEALKIAALDIAEVAQAEDDFFLSDEEGDDMLSTDVSTSVMSNGPQGDYTVDAGSTVSFTSNDSALQKKEILYKEAIKESNVAPKSQRSTIVINENGSFQQGN